MFIYSPEIICARIENDSNCSRTILFWFRIKVVELYSHNWMINSALKSDCDVDFLSVYFNTKIFSLILLIQ